MISAKSLTEKAMSTTGSVLVLSHSTSYDDVVEEVLPRDEREVVLSRVFDRR